VTPENLLEELVGEIGAEYELPDETVQSVDEHTIEISGTLPVDDFSTRFRVALPATRFHTLAVLTFDRLGRVAVVDDELSSAGGAPARGPSWMAPVFGGCERALQKTLPRPSPQRRARSSPDALP
jgi:hypothetical protein